MKPFLTVLRVLGTFLLSVIIIPLMLCTMTLYSVTHVITPEALTKIIASEIFTDSSSDTPDDTVSERSSTQISGLAYRNDKDTFSQINNLSENISDIDPSDVNLTEIINGIKIDEKTGIIYIGQTGKIDIASTGILDIPELSDIKFTEENIKNILASEEIVATFQEYIGNSLESYILEGELPDITNEQLENITNAVLEGVEKEFDVEIPVDVKQNVTNEVSKNNDELSDVVRDVVPSVDEIKEAYCEQTGMDPDDLNKALSAVTAAIKMLFDNTLFYIMLGSVIFIALLMLLINLKNLNGLLVVGILGILNGTLFSVIGILSGIFDYSSNDVLDELIRNLADTMKITGFVAIGISVALIVIKIVVGNIVLGKHKQNKMIQNQDA